MPGRRQLHRAHQHHHLSQSKRLIKLLNYLGAINILGILFIVSMENVTPSASFYPSASESLQHAINSRRHRANRHKGINVTVLELEKFGVSVAVDYPRLPPWWWIEEQYGQYPAILGLDRCAAFKQANRHRANDITVAPVGLFNSGTNLLSQLLETNCVLPKTSADAYHGRAFQPPWGKHTPREFREHHVINRTLYRNMLLDAVLPVVLIRQPYDWMKSVCERPYAIHWKGDHRLDVDFACPGIVNEANRTQEVLVTYGTGNQTYESLAHLWNRWNRAWYDSIAFPRLVIRMEDLLYYPDQVILQVCTCAGGSLQPEFSVPMESTKMKQSGHNQHSRTFLQAFIRYGNFRLWDRFPLQDHLAARTVLDRELMQVFGYQHPDMDMILRNKGLI